MRDDLIPSRNRQVKGLLSQTLVKQPVDIPEHHGIALGVLVTQRITGWRILNTKVVEAASYTL